MKATVTTWNTGLLLSAMALVTGCAKDRNVEDYNNDWANQQKSMIEQNQGTYRGQVSQQGTVTADFSLTVTGANIIPSQDPTGRPQVLMLGSMMVQNAGSSDRMPITSRRFDFDNVRYYAASRTFVGHISDAASGIQIDVSGRFDNGRVEGEVVSGNYEDWKGTFSADQTPRSLSNTARVAYTRLGQSQIPADLNVEYAGSVPARAGSIYIPSGDNSPEVPISLRLENPNANTQSQNLAFAEFFLPVKTVEVTIRLGTAGAQRALAAHLDLRSSTPHLYGHSSAVSTSSTTIPSQTLDCLGTDDGGWICSYSDGSGPTRNSIILRPRGQS